ncbi:betaine/proline/choline family ABC transporter ATP-binding protein [Roseovarius salis]|uniref:quaternary amine ABC transporter ATP-binding protein n=1 Tax=Roseovarius salis TaxID=3376063 RepID=UPI0037C8A4E2
MTNRIEVKNLYKIFGDNTDQALRLLDQGMTKDELLAETGSVLGVDNVSLEVPEGAIFVIMGLSGSGKSTLARCVNRILEPEAGQVLLDGEDVTAVDMDKLREIRRRRMTMVFQSFGLFPNKTVIDNVAFGLKIRGVPQKERHRKAGEILEIVGLSAWGSHRPGALSGGMRQRVGLARALATEADVLIMDEAFSALDPLIRNEMQDELLRLQESLNKTVLFITHDFQEALRIGNRIAIMSDGAIVREGAPQEIVEDPQHEYVAAFTKNVDRARLFDARSIMRPGEPGDFEIDDQKRVKGVRLPGNVELLKDFVKVSPGAKLLEVAECARSGQPIAVVDDKGEYCGHIPMSALLAGITGAHQTDVTRGRTHV